MFPPETLSEGLRWGQLIGAEWAREQEPPRDASGAPWQAEMAGWLGPDHERRATKALRRLHRTMPRAYEVLLRAMVSRESFEEIARWLNERAASRGFSEIYRTKDVVAIFLAGISFCRFWL